MTSFVTLIFIQAGDMGLEASRRIWNGVENNGNACYWRVQKRSYWPTTMGSKDKTARNIACT